MMRPMHGFTLVETLVAITILTLAIIAPFAAVQRVMMASNISKNEIIAASLAQEGLEYVRFVRDNNYLANQSDFVEGNHQMDRMNGVNGPNCTGSARCTVDATVNPDGSTAIQLCPIAGCPALYVDNTQGFYTQQSGAGRTVTPFTRSVNISQQSGYQIVTVTISWEDHGARSIQLRESLYDWL